MLTGGLGAANRGLVCGDAGVTERHANRTKKRRERGEIAKETEKKKKPITTTTPKLNKQKEQ